MSSKSSSKSRSRSSRVPDTALGREAIQHLLSRRRGVPKGPETNLLHDGTVHQTSSGRRIVHLRQEYMGIPLHQAVVSVHFDAGGKVVHTAGKVLRVPRRTVTTPRVDARDAVLEACRRVGQVIIEDGRFTPLKVSDYPPVRLSEFPHPCRPTVLRKRPFSEPITASLNLVKAIRGYRLAWDVHLGLPDAYGEFDVLVAADQPGEPEVLRARRGVAHAVSGRIYEFDPDTANRVSRPFPRPRDAYPVLAGEDFPPGSDLWVERKETKGNNVVSRKANGTKTLKGKKLGSDVVFKPSSPTGRGQRMLNAFYLCNWLHDFFLLFGFDEAAGNFQNQNPSGQGEGGDRLVVRVFDSEFEGIGFIRSRADGTPPEMKMGLNGDRHSALDADIVIHEYAHGVTNRIIGGRHIAEPLLGKEQSQAMAEGYSDYFAITIRNYHRRRQNLSESFVYAAWIADDSSTGLRNHAYGGGFPGTWASMGGDGFKDSHDAGQVWCQALLDLQSQLRTVTDDDRGDELGWQLVMDSLKLITPGPDRPHFLDGRDAILRAFDDKVAAGQVPGDTPVLRQTLMKVFARLGMGPAATSPSADYAGIVPDFGDQV